MRIWYSCLFPLRLLNLDDYLLSSESVLLDVAPDWIVILDSSSSSCKYGDPQLFLWVQWPLGTFAGHRICAAYWGWGASLC